MRKIFNRNFFTLPITFTAALAILAIVSGISLTTKQNIASDNKKVQQVNLQKDSSKKAISSKEKASNSDIINNIVSEKGKVEPTVTPTFILIPTKSELPRSTPTQTQQPTQEAQQIVNVQINEPDGNFNFSLTISNGKTPCSILDDAKSAGKIHSLTIMHYGSPLNSDYVKELNGYSDGWTFSLNGAMEPKGCSAYDLQSNDTVSWKYN